MVGKTSSPQKQLVPLTPNIQFQKKWKKKPEGSWPTLNYP